MSFPFKKLTDNKWKTEFGRNYAHQANRNNATTEKLRAATPSPEYLEAAEVYGLFDKKGDMVGGVVANSDAKFRYFDIVSESVGRQVMDKKGLQPSDFVELTYLWLNRSADQAVRLMLLHDAMWKAFGAGKPYILAGTYARAIMAHQRIAIPNMLYEGKGTVNGRDRSFWLYYESRNKVIDNVYDQMGQAILKGRFGIDGALRTEH